MALKDVEVTDTGDLAASATGDGSVVTDLDAMAQRVKAKFQTWQGELYTDRNFGVPWRSILGEKFNATTVGAILTRAFLEIPGVLKLMRPIRYTIDRQTRELTVDQVDLFTSEGPVTLTGLGSP